jgi:hypothetical protein
MTGMGDDTTDGCSVVHSARNLEIARSIDRDNNRMSETNG